MRNISETGEFFGKILKGGGVIFNPKIYVADFAPFKQWKLMKKRITNKTRKNADVVYDALPVAIFELPIK